jgi:hypothetical protein
VLDSTNSVLLATNVQLQMAHFLIASFLKMSEFKNEVLIAFSLVTQVLLKLVVAAFEIVLAVTEVINSALVNVDQVALSEFKFFGLAVFKILNLV